MPFVRSDLGLSNNFLQLVVGVWCGSWFNRWLCALIIVIQDGWCTPRMSRLFVLGTAFERTSQIAGGTQVISEGKRFFVWSFFRFVL